MKLSAFMCMVPTCMEMQKFLLKLTPVALVIEECQFSCIPRDFYHLFRHFSPKMIAFSKPTQNSASESHLDIADGPPDAGIEGVGPFFETRCNSYWESTKVEVCEFGLMTCRRAWLLWSARHVTRTWITSGQCFRARFL